MDNHPVLESKILSSSNQKNGGPLVNKTFFVKGFQKPYFFLG